MSNHEQHEDYADAKFNKIRTNILWCLLYIALALVVYLDLYVWRPN
jgi:hypothetical protein